MFNTLNAKTREEAFDIIIEQMRNSVIYEPVAYEFRQSGCSCCLYESFTLIYKVNNEYKMLEYVGYINHLDNCALIRCTCNQPFIWSNINPKEIKCDVNERETDYILKNFTSINDDFTSINDDNWQDDNWKDEYETFIKQQIENDAIYKYNEDDDGDEYDIFYYVHGKNYAYYFRKG